MSSGGGMKERKEKGTRETGTHVLPIHDSGVAREMRSRDVASISRLGLRVVRLRSAVVLSFFSVSRRRLGVYAFTKVR